MKDILPNNAIRTVLMVTLLLPTVTSFAQEGKWNRFKMILIQPATAITPGIPQSDIDNVLSKNRSEYYSLLHSLEKALSYNDSSATEQEAKERKAEIKKEIDDMKSQEERVKNAKFFHLISQYSAFTYQVYFNEYQPLSTVSEISSTKTDLANLQHVADSLQADYIVYYDNIHTVNNGAVPVMMITTSVYSHKEKKVIMTKEVGSPGTELEFAL